MYNYSLPFMFLPGNCPKTIKYKLTLRIHKLKNVAIKLVYRVF